VEEIQQWKNRFISRFASKVTIVHQFEKFTANKKAQEKLFANPKMNFIFNSEPRAFDKDGDKMVTEIENLITGETYELVSDGVFVFIGMKPNIELFETSYNLINGLYKIQWAYADKYIGYYAVGDVTSKKYRQIDNGSSWWDNCSHVYSKDLD